MKDVNSVQAEMKPEATSGQTEAKSEQGLTEAKSDLVPPSTPEISLVTFTDEVLDEIIVNYAREVRSPSLLTPSHRARVKSG